jgi:uncharacterized protein (TIGR02594 family)
MGGPTSNALVTEARKYIGTNPTGRASLWCGAFMDLVLKRTGHRGGGNLASAYTRYGTHVSGPQVGAIAVMGRRGGGHVGVVSGIDANGNPIIVSGNHNRTVAESIYPARRIHAYVLPGAEQPSSLKAIKMAPCSMERGAFYSAIVMPSPMAMSPAVTTSA